MSFVYQLTLLGETIEVKNKVAAALAEQYAERFPDDKPYVMGKIEDLKNADVAECLMVWFNLDHEGRRVFAQKLGMPIEFLEDTCEGIKWIFNH